MIKDTVGVISPFPIEFVKYCEQLVLENNVYFKKEESGKAEDKTEPKAEIQKQREIPSKLLLVKTAIETAKLEIAYNDTQLQARQRNN